jgi:hypothetical protein
MAVLCPSLPDNAQSLAYHRVDSVCLSYIFMLIYILYTRAYCVLLRMPCGQTTPTTQLCGTGYRAGCPPAGDLGRLLATLGFPVEVSGAVVSPVLTSEYLLYRVGGTGGCVDQHAESMLGLANPEYSNF